LKRRKHKMAFPCPPDCENGVPYLDWLSYSQLYQEYLTYCALATAAANSPGPGPFMFRGYYEVTTDDDYVAPEDASVIFWNVPTQAGARTITFTGPVGQYTAVVVIDSNGEDVIESGSAAFTLNDAAQRWALVGMTDVPGTVVALYGTAGGYDVGTSGPTVPLLNTANTWSGIQSHTANVNLNGSTGKLNVNTGSNVGDDLITIYPALATLGVQAGVFRYLAGAGVRHGFVVNGSENLSVSSTGTLIATGETGGTRIAKLLTGLATMAGGTIAVPDTALTAGSTIQLTFGFAPLGSISYAKNPGVGFTINSTNAGDAGEISYLRCVL
jgi:hypothetical protein